MKLFDAYHILRRHSKGSFENSSNVAREAGAEGDCCAEPEGAANVSEAMATCGKSEEASIVQSYEENRRSLMRCDLQKVQVGEVLFVEK
jgi:hypothetical protein